MPFSVISDGHCLSQLVKTISTARSQWIRFAVANAPSWYNLDDVDADVDSDLDEDELAAAIVEWRQDKVLDILRAPDFLFIYGERETVRIRVFTDSY